MLSRGGDPPDPPRGSLFVRGVFVGLVPRGASLAWFPAGASLGWLLGDGLGRAGRGAGLGGVRVRYMGYGKGIAGTFDVL